MTVADAHTIDIPALLVHQEPIARDPARYKVVRAGRRGGKTVLAFHCAMVGHGPLTDNDPLYPGVAQGWDVVWVARDYPQARTLWREEIKPRFKGKAHVTLNNSEFDVVIEGCGSLFIRSAENIDSLRGMGKRLIGVIVEEAAWLDFEGVFRDVIRPMLMDNGGWLMAISSTNGGQDGNSEKVAPSFFNRLCADITAGKLPPDWAHWHFTARDNPKIGPKEFAEFKASYPEGSVSWAQEGEAELVQGGAGLAFPEWSTDLHVVQWEAPQSWAWAGGFDWGYESPGCFVLARLAPERTLLLRDELYFRRRTAYQVGEDIGKLLKGRHPYESNFPIFADPSAFNPLDGRPTFAAEVQRGLNEILLDRAPVLTPASQVRTDGKGPRASGKMALHELLRWQQTPTGTLPLDAQWLHLQPALRVHLACANVIRTLPALPLDERDLEDVDTDAEDHAYDAVRYLVQSYAKRPAQEPRRDVSRHVHPGYADGQRKSRYQDDAPRPRFQSAFRVRPQ